MADPKVDYTDLSLASREPFENTEHSGAGPAVEMECQTLVLRDVL